MTRDEIVQIAWDVGLFIHSHPWHDGPTKLERIAERIAAAEREACAKVCEKQIKSYMSKQYTTDPLGGFRERFAAEQCAAAIRARGET